MSFLFCVPNGGLHSAYGTSRPTSIYARCLFCYCEIDMEDNIRINKIEKGIATNTIAIMESAGDSALRIIPITANRRVRGVIAQ
jgi:hypothetical protein